MGKSNNSQNTTIAEPVTITPDAAFPDNDAGQDELAHIGPDKEVDDADASEEMAEDFNPLFTLQEECQADVYLISGNMTRSLADRVIDKLAEHHEKRPNCILYLCTYGGDPDAAYIIARAFKTSYEKFSLYISGYCKSAGTLLALGANEIAMGHKGELGPLDVQLIKADDLVRRASGLDIASSIEYLSNEALRVFQKTFLNIVTGTDGGITTKTAADIAVRLAIGLMTPLMEQLNTLHVVESSRSMDIAMHYGMRLGGDIETIQRLVAAYPQHSFVIDVEEAKILFGNVREYTLLEELVELQIQAMLSTTPGAGINCLRTPSDAGIVGLLNLEASQEDNEETNGGDANHGGTTNSETEPAQAQS